MSYLNLEGQLPAFQSTNFQPRAFQKGDASPPAMVKVVHKLAPVWRVGSLLETLWQRGRA